MHRFIPLALAACVAFPTPAAALDPADRPQIEKIVREYLLANPEVLLEVQTALQAKQEAEAKERATAALKANRARIFDSKHQAVLGNPEGDVTIVEFFDYNCGFCQRALTDMNTLLTEDGNVRFVMKELPILSAGSVEAARISTAIYRLHPDRYGEFHEKLLSLEGQKDGQQAMRIVNELGLPAEPILAEAAKEDVVEAFREANELATALGINGTPSYVVGDEILFGALGVDVLRQKVANMRACGAADCG